MNRRNHLTLLALWLLANGPAGLGDDTATPAADPAMVLKLAGPITRWDEAVPLGNGLTGGLLWGEGNQIRLSLDRGGLWDTRPHPITTRDTWDYAHLKQWVAEGNQKEISAHFDACYDTSTHPTKIPGGRLVIDLPAGCSVGDFALDMHQAIGSVELPGRGDARFLFAATRPVAVATLPVKPVRLRFQRPESLAKLGYPPARFGQQDGLFWMLQETVADGTYAVVVGSRETPAGTELAVTITSAADGPDPLRLGQQRVREALASGFDAIAREHVRWWRDWWATSSVTIPDASLQRHYNLVRYFHAAASRKGAPPMPLQGVWTADTGGLPPWKGDYHHDLNTQTTYIAYPTAGLFDEGLSFLDYNVALLPQYRRFAREFYGLDRGAVVPGVADINGRPLGGWAMYSLSPTHGAWIVQLFRRHWKFTADDEFLRRKAWPFTREIAEALLALCSENEDGHLKLPLSSSPEIHDNSLRAWLTPNSNYDLAMLRMAFDSAAEMATALGLSQEATKFRTALGKLEPWHVDADGVLMFAADEPFAQSHRHHSHLMAVHPFSQLTIEDGPEARRIIDATLDAVERHGTRAWVGYSFSWFACIAARAGRADTALKHLKWYEWCTLRNGFHANGQQRGDQDISAFKYRPFTLEGNFLAMEAIHQMLLQSWRGTVRVFPATPTSWKDAAFRDLRVEGGFKVSAIRRDGRTQSVKIQATVDGALRLRDPFAGAAATWNRPVRRQGKLLLVDLKAGETLEGHLVPPAAASPAEKAASNHLSLAGTWKARIDEADRGLGEGWFLRPLEDTRPVKLPGSLAENGLGHRFDPETGHYEDGFRPPYLKWPSAGYTDAHRRDELGVLVAERMTYGPAWFERTITIPEAWAARPLRLTLERVKWTSQLWVDGQPVPGQGTLSLHTPHVYDLGRLTPGKHRLTLRIDNRPQLNIGFAGHGYGMETEPLWLGVAGRIELIALDPVRVERLTGRPTGTPDRVQLDFELASEAPPRGPAALRVDVIDTASGAAIGSLEHDLTSTELPRTLRLEVPLDRAIQTWDEFHPALYEVRWAIRSDDHLLNQGSRRLGFRTLRREGRRIVLNGAPVFLRGNLDCAIHPDSPTPPTDRAWWERVLRIHKDAGFNHIRFHTWCPPEVAFEAADELGLYLQVETAYWVDDWIASTEPFPHPFGSDAEVDAWVEAESLRIIRRYEHHPSFVLFCIGNEFGLTRTHWEKLECLVARLNASTDAVLVTGTTARRSLDPDEFWVTHRSSAPARGIGPAHTDWDFSDAVQGTDKPLIAHETGQRPSWPDYDRLLPRFDGLVMQPWNLRRLRARAEAAGCADHARRAEASARFALVQYKSEHEAMRRTRGMAGYQLLMLHDFTGQGEALVGLLDPFFREKPGITLEAIRRWNGPTVPLARFAKYTWSDDETFTAKLQVAHEGPDDLLGVRPVWQLTTPEGRVLRSGVLPAREIPAHALTDLGSIEVPLSSFGAPRQLKLVLQVGEAGNDWNLWVYPAGPAASESAADRRGVHVTRFFDEETRSHLAAGERVLLLPHGTTLPRARRLQWASTYWTGAWGWGNGMGLLIDPHHPALAGFPTEAHSDWQWWELIEGGMAIELPPAFADQAAIVEPLADFHLPAREGCIFETRVGPGRLLVCTLDLTSNLKERHAARALRASLIEYAASDAFEPRARLTPEEAEALLRAAPFGSGDVAAIEADSAQAGHGPENVLDGDPATIWHTPWGAVEPSHPHHLTLDLGEVRRIRGILLLPRQDSANGRFRDVAVYASEDGQHWGEPILEERLPDGPAMQKLSFTPRRVRFLKIEVRSETAGRPWASLAELALVSAD